MIRRAAALLVVGLAVSGCGAAKHHAAPPPAQIGSVWTSSAEPSPPGSGGRWTPADEEQLRESNP